MILQNLVWDNSEELLCVRQNGKIEKLDEMLCFMKGAQVSTDTYLNSFSIGKWNKYGNLDKIDLRIRGNGLFLIKVFYSYINPAGKLIEEILDETEKKLTQQQEYVFSFQNYTEGVVYYQLTAMSEEACLLGAEYVGYVRKTNPVKIALNICTYNRENYLLRNLKLLNELFLENEQSDLWNKMEVFVTDNGNTLDIDNISTPNIHVVYNPNVGGTGGFTRGLIEIARVKESKTITHVIFMDDDIEIIPESLVRTYRFLSILKEEYQKSFIAGALINLVKRYEQHENGAAWNMGSIEAYNQRVDLREFYNVVCNEIVHEADYAAWWYCCVPISVVRNDNMPIPIFIHEDDVEYSLRNAQGIISLNGIAVRHPVAENIRVSSNRYYNVRNRMIVCARYCPCVGKKETRNMVLKELLVSLLRYRYKDMKLVYLALKDFCKGPDWLVDENAVEYHKMILEAGYHFVDVSTDLKYVSRGKQRIFTEHISIKDFYEQEKEKGRKRAFWGQLISLNGWLLRGNEETKAFYMGVHPFDLYKEKKILLYDDRSKQGIYVSREFRKIFVFLWIYLKSIFLIQTKYEKSKKSYNEKYGQLTSISVWEKILFLRE